MSKKKILVPTDFSIQSRAALDIAASFARDEDAELLIVHVAEKDFEVYLSLGGVTEEEAVKCLYDAFHEVKPKDESVKFSHKMLDGVPAEEILKLAKEEGVEMIVMGTHGRTGFKRMILGSVAEHVVRHATCPVLTLRDPLSVKEKSQSTAVVN